MAGRLLLSPSVFAESFMAKISPRSLIKESASILEEVMLTELAAIGDAMVTKIIGRARGLTPSERLKAINDIPWPGEMDYQRAITEALAEIALDSISSARAEVPGAKNVKLSEQIEGAMTLAASSTTTVLSQLPAALQRFIKKQAELLVGTQLADLQKNIVYQYTDSYDTTDDMDVVAADLRGAAADYIEGQAPSAGASLLSAKTVNEARNAFFFEPDVLEEVDAFEFVNGDPVTQVCQDLSGTVFAKDDPDMFRYTPPLHWNCKSYIRPIPRGKIGNRQIEKLKPSTKAIEETIQFSEKYLTASAHCPHHP